MLLQTARLVLRPLALEDTDAVHACEALPEVMRYTPHRPRTRDETQESIRKGIAEGEADPRRIYDLGIVERAGGRLVGRSGMGRRAEEMREAAFWYVLHPSVWGRGYAVEASRALLGFAFEELGLHRVIADIDPRNVASVRVAERLGLRREALHVENFWSDNDDGWTDTVIYALLDREWRAQPIRASLAEPA